MHLRIRRLGDTGLSDDITLYCQKDQYIYMRSMLSLMERPGMAGREYKEVVGAEMEGWGVCF